MQVSRLALSSEFSHFWKYSFLSESVNKRWQWESKSSRWLFTCCYRTLTSSLTKPFHCFPSETGSLQYTHKHPISLAKWLLTVAAHRMLRIFVRSSRNNASNTGSEICNKSTQFLNKNIKSEDTVSCNWPRDLRRSLQPLDHWDQGFESRWGHGCSFLVLVVCCVGSGLRCWLITRSEES